MVFRECCEDFSVERDSALFERVDELAIRREARGAHGGVDTDAPQLAVCTLVLLAVAECIGACFKYGIARRTLFFRSCETIALDLLQDRATAFQCMHSSFYSSHILVASRAG